MPNQKSGAKADRNCQRCPDARPRAILCRPIYEAYQKDLLAINDRLGKTILAYADAYNNKALSDDLAKQLTRDALAIDQDELTLRKTYAAKLNGVLPAMKMARYIQIENKIRAAIRYDLATGIPLVP